jgi:hypothetical protein
MLEKKIIDNQSPKYQQIINTADELFKKFVQLLT